MKKSEIIATIVLCLLVLGPFTGQEESFIQVTGRVGNLARKLRIAVTSGDALTPPHDVISTGATGKLEEVVGLGADNARANRPNRITGVTVHQSMTNNYTAFATVEPDCLTARGRAIRIRKLVPVPDGVRYETVVPR